MAKINLGINGSPVKIEGETDSTKTAGVVKHTVNIVGKVASKSFDTIRETSDMILKHNEEKEKLRIQKDQQEHEQKMETKEFNNNKKGLFDKWSEHKIHEKELELKQKELEEAAERKKRILTIIGIVAVIFAILIFIILLQKFGK